ncbi:Isoflavone 2'-hydroxylase, partial [Mucuna pruriens]
MSSTQLPPLSLKCYLSLHYTSTISSTFEPKTYKKAIKSSLWIEVMNSEIAALNQNDTRDITPLPPGKMPIGCKWVYKVKCKVNGTIERYKARLVAKGFNQIEGIDYFDTCSPVAKLFTIRFLLAIAASKQWHLHQLDVHNAFLHGNLDEEVYMKLLEGILPTPPSQVCKLKKSLYGLKQASRQWFAEFSSSLLSQGHSQSSSGHSLFLKHSNNSFTALFVYVDDLILAGDNITEINAIREFLNRTFKIKDLENLKHFLGLEIARSKVGIHICQKENMAWTSCQIWDYLATKLAFTHMTKGTKLKKEGGEPLTNPAAYRRLISRLLYLTTTLPDINQSVKQLSQFMSCLTTLHHHVAISVLRYIKTTLAHGLFYSTHSKLQLKAFSDSNPQLATAYFLMNPLYPGNQRNKPPYQNCSLRLNITVSSFANIHGMEEADWRLIVITSSGFVLLFLYVWKFILKRKNLPPSPPALPLIGHLHLIKEPLYQSLHNLTDKYGKIIFLKLGTRKVLVASSPSAVEECFTKNDIAFANRPKTLAAKHLNYNSKTIGFASYGDYWRNLRRLTTVELFSTTRLGMFTSVREEEVKLLVKQLFEECGGQEKITVSKVDLRQRFLELSFNIMVRMISGKRYYGKNAVALEGKEFQILMKEFLELLGNGNLNDFFPILQWVDFQGVEKKMVKLMKKMDSFFQKLLDEHCQNRNVCGGKDRRDMTLIDVMLDLQHTEPEFYTHETVKGLILAMLIAGSETSATTMEWALSLLLNHPEKMKKVRDEIETCAGKEQLISELDTTKLKYLQNVITETLRLYPVAPLLLPHESSIDCKVCGFDIPRGTMLLVNVWTLHRDPNLWADPTSFVPERFEGLESDQVLYNMLPFGIGRRACPGAVLAKRVMAHALAALIQSFDWDTIGHKQIDMREGIGITLPKLEPLLALCHPRQGMIKVLSNI